VSCSTGRRPASLHKVRTAKVLKSLGLLLADDVAPEHKLAYDWCNKAINAATGKQGEATMEILAITAATLAVVWIIVLWGSRYFGPR
jgi:hypothetical protein